MERWQQRSHQCHSDFSKQCESMVSLQRNCRRRWRDELRGHSKTSEDHKWLMVASKLAEQTRSKGERVNNLDLSKGPIETRSRDKFGIQEDNKFDTLNFSMLNLESKFTENVGKSSLRNGVYNMNVVYPKNNASLVANISGNKYKKQS
ncbi:hypothetical protein QN277_029434 [Acacia crassicarpa]|uniref:Uncharacterized protein n=2 Tax=Acacia crassicarpa TaxID=499986 RepID=A0AAE1MGC2_9FABA|nr:hypothetical protein QN277_029434 [Acacia crassicarpa]